MPAPTTGPVSSGRGGKSFRQSPPGTMFSFDSVAGASTEPLRGTWATSLGAATPSFPSGGQRRTSPHVAAFQFQAPDKRVQFPRKVQQARTPRHLGKSPGQGGTVYTPHFPAPPSETNHFPAPPSRTNRFVAPTSEMAAHTKLSCTQPLPTLKLSADARPTPMDSGHHT
jgi:hypothetical protein